MGNRILTHKISLEALDAQWQRDLKRKLKLKEASFVILQKSLDARKKNQIHWQMQILVHSPEITTEEWKQESRQLLEDRLENFRSAGGAKQEKVLVVGSGPAGLFPALALNRAGYQVTWIERGQPVEERRDSIARFEQTGRFEALGNYATGEGGAGTFSDGKLTSRSKGISREKEFIINRYLKAGAPQEIAWLNHPHLGSDNLFSMTQNLRRELQEAGVDIRFRTTLEDMIIKQGKVQSCIINGQEETYGRVVLAPGHSHYPTYRMLLNRGILFRPKVFALGFRAEHPQSLINLAQWGRESLPGVKAAEYRLTDKSQGTHRVYSFCMCPGGQVVPAAPSEDVNIVNGMSLYRRDGRFANAAVVCSFHPSEYLGPDPDAGAVLSWLEGLERHFKTLTGDFRAPACSIKAFLAQTGSPLPRETSYPLGLKETDLWNQLPAPIIRAIRDGLYSFSSMLRGYEEGILLGLESKSSAPLQLVRGPSGAAEGVENLFITGEGSGWAGGIISSGADGLRNTASLWE
ncbi:MAG: FAD-dependent monooxygenase [Spirochaetales bacterium]|nr:FAD-dependent monooxygenase [Spirochaetales bacterium]